MPSSEGTRPDAEQAFGKWLFRSSIYLFTFEGMFLDTVLIPN